MTHGYMLSGSGSNVYVQNLCRALVSRGHEVHLLCQEPHPLDYDFVDEHFIVAGPGNLQHQGRQDTPYKDRCTVYRPAIGDLLPVYVYDDYPGWRVKTFLDLTDEELEGYVRRNVAALKTVLNDSDAEAVVTNHSVPGPLISGRALEDTGVPYTSIVHGSCLQYVSRKSERYMSLTRAGLDGARRILALSSHSAGTIAEDFPEMKEKTIALPGGVDTNLFHPGALDASVLRTLRGGLGRGPEQEKALREAVNSEHREARDFAEKLHSISKTYDARATDQDAGERIERLLKDGAPTIIYVGKLIHSKGVHSLTSAFTTVRREIDARLLIVGYGTFREALEALTFAFSKGDERTVRLLAEGGSLFEGGSRRPMKHLTLSRELPRDGEGLEDSVEFAGPLYHQELAKLLPLANVAVVPSIFPETFGLVAAEFAASGVVPFVAAHSGLREAGEIVQQGLPFDLRIGMDDFERNLARQIIEYLKLPDAERQRCGEIVRRNAVDHLGWDTLARRVVEIAAGGAQASP